jgi:SAM-dependent methyltransferase
VVAIDGMLMVTQYDVEWKEEMTGWHFYDISQSIEFNKLGYRVVVPYQEKCWVLHDAEYCLMSNYDKDRETFCKIYADCGFVYRKEDDSRYTQMQERYINEKGRLIHCIECGEVNEAEKYAEKLKEICDADADADIVLFEILYEVYQQDRKKRGNSSVFSQKDWEKEKGIYNYIKFLTRRLEYGFELSEYVDLINIISKMVVSFDYVYAVVMHSTIFQERIWSELSFRLSGQVGQTEDEMLFDWYQRYHTLAEMIRRVKRVYHMDKSRILEVGANVQKNLGKELSEDDIYYTDLEVPEQFAYSRRYFQADATDLHEIKDNTFDFCVASDVFEHILPEKRASFIKELYRVADKAVFFCFPRKSAKVEEAEKEVNAHFRAITGENHRWLKEHIDNGLPDCDTVDDYLKQQNITFATFEHGELEMWKKIQKVHSIEVICPDCVEMRTCIDQFYNKHIYKYDMGKENYRIFYVLMKNGKMDGFEDMFENCENEENERQIYEMCDEMLQICILRNSVLNRI